MKYKVFKRQNSYEKSVTCVNVFNHKQYSIFVYRLSSGRYEALFEVRDYFKSKLSVDYIWKNRSFKRHLLSKELTKMTTKQIDEILKIYPWELLVEAFSDVIPDVYISNKRVKSHKYKRLLPHYQKYEKQYSLATGKGNYAIDMSDFYHQS